ncbi:hypothetical protein [Xanthomonas phage vB_XooS_NR08]|nr:hypothetical protein [Xanthomonas phage vB_XooS_NR08]
MVERAIQPVRHSQKSTTTLRMCRARSAPKCPQGRQPYLLCRPPWAQRPHRATSPQRPPRGKVLILRYLQRWLPRRKRLASAR